MKVHHPLHVLGLTLLATPALAERTAPISTADAPALRAHEDPSLGDLRAGAIVRGAELPATERAVLQRVESTSPDLGDLRAGSVELSDRDLTIIAIVVGVVLILVLL